MQGQLTNDKQYYSWWVKYSLWQLRISWVCDRDDKERWANSLIWHPIFLETQLFWPTNLPLKVKRCEPYKIDGISSFLNDLNKFAPSSPAYYRISRFFFIIIRAWEIKEVDWSWIKGSYFLLWWISSSERIERGGTWRTQLVGVGTGSLGSREKAATTELIYASLNQR